jgi:hypothetical protein
MALDTEGEVVCPVLNVKKEFTDMADKFASG